ncbi:hypothetical protein C8Q76DRAFT_748775 [Earliella scabrosa]|nr:hypothetical protein C8Q76DRAFT_748775 [Earliella scabrosa]
MRSSIPSLLAITLSFLAPSVVPLPLQDIVASQTRVEASTPLDTRRLQQENSKPFATLKFSDPQIRPWAIYQGRPMHG